MLKRRRNEGVEHCCFAPHASVQGDIFFVPQRPYVVLGTLRDQLLYPTWAQLGDGGEDDAGLQGTAAASNGTTSTAALDSTTNNSTSSSTSNGSSSGRTGSSTSSNADPASKRRPLPSDAQLRQAMQDVQVRPERPAALSALLLCLIPAAPASAGPSHPRCCRPLLQLGSLLDRIGGNLDAVADWASTLSLGEQQRLAFARVLLAKVGGSTRGQWEGGGAEAVGVYACLIVAVGAVLQEGMNEAVHSEPCLLRTACCSLPAAPPGADGRVHQRPRHPQRATAVHGAAGRGHHLCERGPPPDAHAVPRAGTAASWQWGRPRRRRQRRLGGAARQRAAAGAGN